MTRRARQRAGLLSIAIVVVLSSVATSPPAHAADDPLQPGDLHRTSVGQCTLNFVFDGTGVNAGRTYIGTAAHCVSAVGQFAYDSADVRFGHVAYRGDANDNSLDFALIEVNAANVGRVTAAVKGHPGYPSGVATPPTVVHVPARPGEVVTGDVVQISGQGAGYAWTTETQEQRKAALTAFSHEEFGIVGPLHWGDSGGPLVHERSGTALGVVSRFCNGSFTGLLSLRVMPCDITGPTIEGIIAAAGSAGFTITLRTVSR